MTVEIINGDCLEVMRGMDTSCVDSIVTDPPYGLRFMGKKWDYSVPGVEVWKECLRVLKPGGHLLSFAGTRTQHRMAVNIEDAGFEIRDMIAWVYGSGFPKSHNLTGDWTGWGTALKPALEPITVARKPLDGAVAENVLEHGTGAINIDGCRIQTDDSLGGGAEKSTSPDQKHGDAFVRPWMSDEAAREKHAAQVRSNVERAETIGRWPANLIHDGSEEVTALFPDPNGQQGFVGAKHGDRPSINAYGDYGPRPDTHPRGDTGSAARFFYCAKASRRDRNEGCESREKRPLNWSSGTQSPGTFQSKNTDRSSTNNHPTVKPTELMRYLCRLVTPKGGIVLDPFMGSGSTGKGAVLEGFSFIGIELSGDDCEIADKRIRQLGLCF